MNIFKKFFSTSNDSTTDEIQSIYIDNQIIDDKTTEEKFTINFMNNGGKFIYCENMSEVHEHFLDILVENDWFESNVLCNETFLHSILEENKLEINANSSFQFYFATCESLISDEGSVLFTSTQLKHLKPNELPVNIVILASISKIVENKTVALQKLNKNYPTNNYPTNITAIKYFTNSKNEDFMHYGSTAKNLYLLLLDDQSS